LPHRVEATEEWQVALNEWHLVGPQLMALIVFLSKRMRGSRARVQEFLWVWLGLHLSTGTINQCIHEAGRAVEPIEDQLVDEIVQAALVHIDETSWKESGEALWLWVFSTVTVTLFLIGYRNREMIDNVLGELFAGWLMSDGYSAYRFFKKRLRCWAHLQRKARGLEQSLVRDARRFGAKARKLLDTLIKAVYQAREAPGRDLVKEYKDRLDGFRAWCQHDLSATHKKTRELAGEFLNDWDAIFRVLAHPHLPLTNNEAERALRHWVIARKISHGTRTAQGSRALGLLASVIDTCRKRNLCPWRYLARVISARRQGLEAPPIPAPG
jgi:hypothetical protein